MCSSASDVAALVRYTRQVVYLEDGEVATIKATDYRTTTLTGSADNSNNHRTPTTVDADVDDYELGAYKRLHARKEIHEQLDAIRRAVIGQAGRAVLPPRSSAGSTSTPVSCATSSG